MKSTRSARKFLMGEAADSCNTARIAKQGPREVVDRAVRRAEMYRDHHAQHGPVRVIMKDGKQVD